EAAAEFQLALGLEPTNEGAAIGLAHAFQLEGKITEAEGAYQQAIQAHPNSRSAYNNFGAFYLGRNQYQNALQMYAKAIQIAPEWYATYSNVGNIYNQMGQYEKAIDPLKKSIAIRPSYAAYVNLGVAYFGLNKFSDAAEQGGRAGESRTKSQLPRPGSPWRLSQLSLSAGRSQERPALPGTGSAIRPQR